jgi:hypothetical protein
MEVGELLGDENHQETEGCKERVNMIKVLHVRAWKCNNGPAGRSFKEGMGGASRGYEFDWGALYAHMEVSRWTPLHNWCMLIKQKINTLKKKENRLLLPRTQPMERKHVLPWHFSQIANLGPNSSGSPTYVVSKQLSSFPGWNYREPSKWSPLRIWS